MEQFWRAIADYPIGVAIILVAGVWLVRELTAYRAGRIVRSLEVQDKHPANAGVLRLLERWSRKRPDKPADWLPDRLPLSVFKYRSDLELHPDLVIRIWDELPRGLPVDCRWVVYGAPVLVHPETGIVFAFAVGGDYALRLPPKEREEAAIAEAERVKEVVDSVEIRGEELEAHLAKYFGRVRWDPRTPTIDLDELGEEWVFGLWDQLDKETRWCRAAYEYAGMLDPSVGSDRAS